MKITYLTHQYLPRHVGGTEVYTHGLATRARRAGHDAQVITYVESPSLNHADYGAVITEHEGIPVVEVHYNLSRADHPARAEYDNRNVAAILERVLQNAKPDLVHAMHSMKLSAAALEICYDKKIPVVLTLPDYWFICPRHTLLRSNNEVCQGPAHDLDCLKCSYDTHGFAAGRLQRLPASILRRGSDWRFLHASERRFWRDIQAIRERSSFLRNVVGRADCVIALSEFQKQIFVRNGYDAAKIRVIHHGLETKGLLPAASATDNPIQFVSIGSLVYHKGPHVLLEALARRPHANVRLLLYGDLDGSNAYLDSLQRAVAADQRVKLMGTFPVEQMGAVLQSAHALLMPALWYENEPLVVKAAQYVGLPILASDIGTLSTVSRARLISPGDVEAWADALATFRPHPFEPDASIKSMDDNARELFDLYETIHSNH